MNQIKFRLIVIYGFFWIILGVLSIIVGYMVPVFYENNESLMGLMFQQALYIIGVIELIIGVLSINFYRIPILYRAILTLSIVSIPTSILVLPEIFHASKYFILFISIFSFLTLVSIWKNYRSRVE